ncbi:MAG: histidine kinase [Lachnospiraceae bacterium]|nr:histidine kinase [Lachnospiraceae bacterium]
MITSTVIDMINFSIAITGITIALMGLILTNHIGYMERWTRTFFILLFTILFIYEASDLVSQISLEFLGNNMWLLSGIAIFCESLFSSILTLMLTAYILHAANESYSNWLFIINLVLWILYVILLVITQFTKHIYYITDKNLYMRGPLYPLLLIPPLLIMLMNLIGLYLRKDRLSARTMRAFMTYLLLPMLSMIIQMRSYGLLLIVLGTAIASLVLFIHILNNETEKAIKLATGLLEKEYRISSLQIRPHFIYNTLSNIYYLCDINPEKAQTAIGDFTEYLRNNFSAVARQGLIPFEDELKHTKAYLAVVKMRYEDLLFVEYETEYTAFNIPPLTLEPIAENAVKYGLDPEAAPLHVLIRTEKKEGYAEIVVENSGSGFSLNDDEEYGLPDDGTIHIGLKNVMERLKTLCGGTLTIVPGEGDGTVAAIRVPFDAADTADSLSS